MEAEDEKVKIVLNLRDRRKRFISRRETLKKKIADRVGLDPDAVQLECLNWETKKWERVEPSDLKDKDEIRVADLEKILNTEGKEGELADSCDGTLSSSDEEKCMQMRKKLRKKEELTDTERMFICNILWCRERIPGISTRGGDSIQDKETQTMEDKPEDESRERIKENGNDDDNIRNGDYDRSKRRKTDIMENGDTDDDEASRKKAKKKKLDEKVCDSRKSKKRKSSQEGKLQKKIEFSESDESNELSKKKNSKDDSDSMDEVKKDKSSGLDKGKSRKSMSDKKATQGRSKSSDSEGSMDEQDKKQQTGKSRRSISQKRSRSSDSEYSIDEQDKRPKTGRSRRSVSQKSYKETVRKKHGSDSEGSGDSEWNPDDDERKNISTMSLRNKSKTQGSESNDNEESVDDDDDDWGSSGAKSKKSTPKKKGREKRTSTKKSEKTASASKGKKKDAISEKKHLMVMELKKDEPDDELLAKLMEDTFVARQDYILYDTPSIKDVLKAYPALFNVKEVVKEFGRIKDRELYENYKNNLLKYASVIIENAPSSSSSSISEIIQDGIGKAKSQKEKNYLKSAAVILLLPTFLDESVEKFIVFEKTVKDVFPMIVCSGPLKEIFSPKTNFKIMVEMLKLCETDDLVEAFFAYFAAFYIFSIEFPTSCTKTVAVVESLFIEAEPEYFPPQSLEVKKLILSKYEEKRDH